MFSHLHIFIPSTLKTLSWAKSNLIQTLIMLFSVSSEQLFCVVEDICRMGGSNVIVFSDSACHSWSHRWVSCLVPPVLLWCGNASGLVGEGSLCSLILKIPLKHHLLGNSLLILFVTSVWGVLTRSSIGVCVWLTLDAQLSLGQTDAETDHQKGSGSVCVRLKD